MGRLEHLDCCCWLVEFSKPLYCLRSIQRLFFLGTFQDFRCLLKLALNDFEINFVCLFVFVALRPKSTAMVVAGRSVHLTTLFPGQA